MPPYQHPGVYIEEVPSGARPIEAVSTSTTAFIGVSPSGPTTPLRVTKWDDFARDYPPDPDNPATDMELALSAYFRNGGGAAYIVRVEDTTLEKYQAAFAALRKVDEVGIICLPGQTLPANGNNPVIDEALSHAETMQDRMIIVDPPAGLTEQEMATKAENDLTPSKFAALYYPWLDVANPRYDPEADPPLPKTVPMAPSGMVAGVWARTDLRRGVWKAPAGVETALLGVSKLEVEVEDSDQDILNPKGVNCIRRLPGYGNVVWGARTIAAEAQWRYIPVRRTALMIEESIQEAIQWAVFEPNDHPLWSAIRTSIGSFMDGLFRAGAFQGATANEAYFVRCGLDDTMNQDNIDRGEVVVLVGFAPVKPAEFVIVRIQQKVAQQ